MTDKLRVRRKAPAQIGRLYFQHGLGRARSAEVMFEPGIEHPGKPIQLALEIARILSHCVYHSR
ncbi:MAG: hypothetical protein QOH88_3131 [Verrucomicrobiota bacterium]|jgi:hypothetical protein